MRQVVLHAQSLTMQFGGLRAVADVELKIEEGAIVGLIGPNGAGKTTVFNMLTGVYRPTFGSIQALGNNLVGKKPHQIARLGVARTFQNIRLFKKMTVLENLLVAVESHPETDNYGFWAAALETQSKIQEEEEIRERAERLLTLFNLADKSDRQAQFLPYGDQRRLEIARALATGAKLILLDEPAAGLNPHETITLMDTIRQVRDDFAVTVLLIEHDMKLVMGICERITVLDHGVKIAEGSAQEIQKNPRVIEAYLGKGTDKAHATSSSGEVH